MFLVLVHAYAVVLNNLRYVHNLKTSAKRNEGIFLLDCQMTNSLTVGKWVELIPFIIFLFIVIYYFSYFPSREKKLWLAEAKHTEAPRGH